MKTPLTKTDILGKLSPSPKLFLVDCFPRRIPFSIVRCQDGALGSYWQTIYQTRTAKLAQQVLQRTNRLPEVTMKYTKPQIKKHDELKQVTFSSH